MSKEIKTGKIPKKKIDFASFVNDLKNNLDEKQITFL